MFNSQLSFEIPHFKGKTSGMF